MNPYNEEIYVHELEKARIERGVALVAALGLTPVKDGNQWAYLLGKDLQSGIAGFGDTALKAAEDFELAFCAEKIKKNEFGNASRMVANNNSEEQAKFFNEFSSLLSLLTPGEKDFYLCRISKLLNKNTMEDMLTLGGGG